MTHDLGLDDLGVSLDTVIDAMEHPGGDRDRQLIAALRDEAGEASPSQAPREMNAQFDDIGLYRPAG